jgi:hypothetical protein
MEDVLAVYTRPRDGDCPLVCLDETSKQLIAETRMPISMKAGRPARFDYEYERNVVGEAFLMQLHRSRPDPRLSTFERCWLSGATGLAQRTGDTRDLFALRSPGSVSRSAPRARPLKRTALLAKPVNRINAPQRPDCVAGHVGLELRNVVAKRPIETPHRFCGIQRNSGH